MKKIILIECPFCGSKDLCVWRGMMSDRYVVGCQDCGIKGPESSTDKGARLAWNKRFNEIKEVKVDCLFNKSGSDIYFATLSNKDALFSLKCKLISRGLKGKEGELLFRYKVKLEVKSPAKKEE